MMNIDVEGRAIGDILSKGNTHNYPHLTPECFTTGRYRSFYEAIIELENSGTPVTVESVAAHIGDDGFESTAHDCLYNLWMLPSFNELETQRILVGLRQRRDLEAICKDGLKVCRSKGDLAGPVDSLVGRLVASLSSANAGKVVGLGQEVIDAVRDADEPITRGVQTGFWGIDNYLGGLRPGQLIILAARPGVGKSALSMNIATNVAKSVNVMVFNLEMSARELAHRVMAGASGVDASRLIRGATSTEERVRITRRAAEVFPTMERVRVVDQSTMTPAVMRSHLRRESLTRKLSLVVVDYIQLMESGKKRESQNVDVGLVSRGLKVLAKDFDVPVLALSQLNRGIENRQDRIPRLADLRDSGSLEQDADVVMFIHREEFSDAAQLIVAKQRKLFRLGGDMIHYHGLPITPNTACLSAIGGGHAFVSFAHRDQLGIAVESAQSFAVDNGAFSSWRSGSPISDWSPYYRFVKECIAIPSLDFAVIPDVIDGSEDDNDALVSEWPHGKFYGAPVWHMHESIERLVLLSVNWPRVCIGSSGEYQDVGSRFWWGRIGEAMRAVCDDAGRPTTKIHGLRMLDPDVFQKLPLSSADSTNIGRNIGIDSHWSGSYRPPSKDVRAAVLRSRIESTQAAAAWGKGFAPKQEGLF